MQLHLDNRKATQTFIRYKCWNTGDFMTMLSIITDVLKSQENRNDFDYLCLENMWKLSLTLK